MSTWRLLCTERRFRKFSAKKFHPSPLRHKTCIYSAGGIMSFGLYLAGYVLFIIGLAYAAHLLHVSPQWIGVGVLVLAGIGVFSGVKATRTKDIS
jgi:uncharacterized membrane protein YiaA